MAVYNGAEHLAGTLDSVLDQQDVDLEFIVVDDGSTDGTADLLSAYGRQERRLRCVRQTHAGLTQALIRGCGFAKAEFIARQDCADRSLDGRLSRQVALLRRRSDAVLASCGTRFLSPDGDFLYEIMQAEDEAADGFSTLDWQKLRGPSIHGTTMFRRCDYEAVGGYRAQFRVAQDLDLWLRFAERGNHVPIDEVLYEARFATNSITARARSRQVQAARLGLECARRRRAGLDEAPVLADVAVVTGRPLEPVTNLQRARALYFYGACLRARDPVAARRYFFAALREFPLHLRSWCGVLSSIGRV